jgi:hypothetical protein
MAKDLVIDLAIRYGFQVLGALVILLVGALLGRWLGRMVDRRLRARAMEPPMRLLITRVLRSAATSRRSSCSPRPCSIPTARA